MLRTRPRQIANFARDAPGTNRCAQSLNASEPTIAAGVRIRVAGWSPGRRVLLIARLFCWAGPAMLWRDAAAICGRAFSLSDDGVLSWQCERALCVSDGVVAGAMPSCLHCPGTVFRADSSSAAPRLKAATTRPQ